MQHDRNALDSIAVFRRLALLRGVSLGSLQSGRGDAYRIVLAAAARSVASRAVYTESEVNELLKAWLAGPGDMLATDHVELRRSLVDARLLERDGFGRQYRRTAPTGDWPRLLAALEGIDLAAVARAARREDAEERALRKARWQQRQAGVAEAER